MSDATDRARELLAAAKQPDGHRARHSIQLLGFTPDTLAVAIKLAEGYEGRCWHQELYGERNDGASVMIYPNIMHEGKCGDDTECEPCGACTALAEFDALFPEV